MASHDRAQPARGAARSPAAGGGDAHAHAAADDEIERQLNDIFLAYSVPCGITKGGGGGGGGVARKDMAGRLGVALGKTATADAMDEIGWQQLCSDCKLDEDSSVPPALPVFKEVAQGDLLEFAEFLKVLKIVARVRYGGEDLAPLLYFKIFRFARGAAQHKPLYAANPTPSTPRNLWHGEDGAVEWTSASAEYFARLHALHTSVAQDCPPMLAGEKELMGAFERYRAGLPGVGLQGLAQMCSDVHLIPSLMSYAQMRSHYNSTQPGDDGLNYSSFLNTLLALAGLAFEDERGDPVEKLMAAIRKHLPAPPAHVAIAFMQQEISSEDEAEEAGVNDSVVKKWIVNKTDAAKGLEESLSKVKQEAQRRLEKLAEDFAKKQVELHEQRMAAESELESEVQLELAQNAVRSARHRRIAARPSTERLDLEERIAALDRSRACRPSRSSVEDGSTEKLESERATLVRQATALKAAEEARYIAEMENEENKTAQKIKENGKRKLKRLTTESERLEDAMQTDMKKKHQEIAKWYEAATRMCQERHVMICNTPPEVARPSPAKLKGSPAAKRSGQKSAQASDGFALRPEKLSSTGQVGSHRQTAFGGLKLDLGKSVQGSALTRLQSRLKEVFSNIYHAFVFLDANDKGVLDSQDLNRQIARICPEVSADQIRMELIVGADDDQSSERETGIPLERFLRHLSWHPIPSLRRLQREAIADARRQKQKALTEFYNWQLRRDPKTGGARTVSGITLDDLALLPVSEIAEAVPAGASSARSAGAYMTWKGTLRKYSDDINIKSAPRSRQNAGCSVTFTPESTPRSFAASTPRSFQQKGSPSLPRAWISDGQREIAKTQLLREKRKLAVQLLEAERKLMQAGGLGESTSNSDLQTGRHRPSNKGKVKHTSERQPASRPGSATTGRGYREFIGPKGPYRELTATDRLVSSLRDDRPATLEKCMTRMGLWMTTPPRELRVQEGEKGAASWRDPTSLHVPQAQTQRHQRAAPRTREPPPPAKGSPPKRPQDHEKIIDECLELVAGLMYNGSSETARREAKEPQSHLDRESLSDTARPANWESLRELASLSGSAQLHSGQSASQTSSPKPPSKQDSWPLPVGSASSVSDRDHGTEYTQDTSDSESSLSPKGVPRADLVFGNSTNDLEQSKQGSARQKNDFKTTTTGKAVQKSLQKPSGTTKAGKAVKESSQEPSRAELKEQQKLKQREQTKKIFARSDSDSDSG